jgi:dTDP-4-dehydrorhamnose 3,5-epimerase
VRVLKVCAGIVRLVKVEPLGVAGAFAFTPVQHHDKRGTFLEMVRAEAVEPVIGDRLVVAQSNVSIQVRGALRGMHAATVPPGQAKYVTCVRGSVFDVLVDLREGSPTFLASDSLVLDDVERRAVYLPEGIGHGFHALADDTVVIYLTSTAYDPASEFTVNAFDPELALPWPSDPEPVLSDRDRAAPRLAEVRAAGLLPSYAECVARAELRRSGQ